MRKIEDTLFIIQARVDSSRIERKMIRPFADSCLFEIAIKKVLSSKIPKENFYVSILDKELEEIALKYKVNMFMRGKGTLEEPITLQKIFEWRLLPFKHYVNLGACNPLVTTETIDNFIEEFLAMPEERTGMFAVVPRRNFFYNSQGKMINLFHGKKEHLVTLETKLVGTTYEAAHTLYAGQIEDIEKGIYMGNFENYEVAFYSMKEEEVFDIDYPWQFDLAEQMYILRNK